MAYSSCTITIQNSVNWSLGYVQQRVLSGIAAISGEPAITAANIIMATILGPPFHWEWNRTSQFGAITTQPGVSDYPVFLQTFGYLEKAAIYDPSAPGQLGNPQEQGVWPKVPKFELEVYKVLTQDSQRSRPLKIATLLDNNAGTITFRLFPAPDKAYKVDLVFQNAPLIIAQGTNLTSVTWAPIPDKMAHVYQQGFLARLQGTYNSQLYLSGTEMFLRQLVSTAEGLTEMEKAIYLTDSLRALKTQAASQLEIQQGKGVRT